MSSYVTDHMEPAMTLPPPPLRTARYGAYAGWQLRDYLIDKGIGTVLVMLFVASLAYLETRVAAPHMSPDQVRQVLEGNLVAFLGFLLPTGVLFATNGIVSDDRKNGYYRFLFAKPVNVARFYVQKFVVHGVGFMLVTALLVALFALVFGRFVPDAGITTWMRPSLFGAVALVYMSLASIGFLLSAAWRVDWLSFIGVYTVASLLWPLWGDEGGWRGAVVYLLPPVQFLGGVYGAVVRGQPLPTHDLMWLVGYGLASFVAGVVVVRTRSLATS